MQTIPVVEKILAVTTETKPLWQFGGEQVLFYNVQTDGVPGHNVYSLPAHRFDGVPQPGAYIKYVADASALNSSCGVYWHVQKER